MATHDKPTARQQRYLRSLAQSTGTSFTPPATKHEASREIDRLKALTRSPRHEHRTDRRAVEEAARGGATRVDESEIAGYASCHLGRAGPAMTHADRHALHQLSIAQWENGRTQRVHDLARALTGVLDSAAALPDGCHDTPRQLPGASEEIRTELHATLARPNPLRRTVKDRPQGRAGPTGPQAPTTPGTPPPRTV